MSLHIDAAVRLLADSRATHTSVDWRHLSVVDTAAAYAVQDATVEQLGTIGGWKVGSKGDGSEPSCAPLPASGVLPSGAALRGSAWKQRGLEVELAFRVGKDIDPGDAYLTTEALMQCFDAMVPVVEVVETRLGNMPCGNPLVSLADLLSHGALIIGTPVPMPKDLPDVRRITASLSLDGKEVARVTGGNPAGDVWPVLSWLARHCSLRGKPLKKGQIVTTGSCTGVDYARLGDAVRAEVEGVGVVELSFPTN